MILTDRAKQALQLLRSYARTQEQKTAVDETFRILLAETEGTAVMEPVFCKCGKAFAGGVPELRVHWDDPTRDMTKHHYRTNADGSDYYIESVSRPSMSKPNRKMSEP